MRSLEDTLKNLPTNTGVYIFKDCNLKPMYVGKANNLKSRVNSYFLKNINFGPKTLKLVKNIKFIEYILTETEFEALLLEADLIKRLKPKYNIRHKDDKSYKYIKITIQEEFPRLGTVRSIKNDKAKYFGPFPRSETVKKVLKDLRHMFPYCNEKVKTGKACFYYHLKLCPGPCAFKVSKTAYRKTIQRLIRFLSGKKKKVLSNIKNEMKVAVKREDFEKAASLRDQIKMIDYITLKFRSSNDYLENPNLVVDQKRLELQKLIKILKIYKLIDKNYKLKKGFRIECFDVSNLKGKYAAGSMVVFTDGQENKSHYRRFKVRYKDSIDDVKMIQEIMSRRLTKVDNNHIKDASFKIKPDIILIDGGKGQLSGVLKVFKDKGIFISCIGLAKRLEEIIYFDKTDKRYKSIVLDKSSKALNLLRRIRDEAHRFSVKYHKTLRAKATFI